MGRYFRPSVIKQLQYWMACDYGPFKEDELLKPIEVLYDSVMVTRRGKVWHIPISVTKNEEKQQAKRRLRGGVGRT